jgi:acyl-coenzyme A thioesterase PaaI-like protein
MKEFYDDNSEYNQVEEDFRDLVHTHQNLNPLFVGKIKDIQEGYARTELTPNIEMATDEHHLLFTGFIFNAANYTAMLAVNQENIITSSAKIIFLEPMKISTQPLVFEAMSKHKESRKKMIKVTGTQHGIKFFEGEFATLTYDSNVLDIKLYEREHDNHT